MGDLEPDVICIDADSDTVTNINTSPQGQKKRTFLLSAVSFHSEQKKFKGNEHVVWLERISNTVNTAEEQVPLIVEGIEAKSAYYESIVLLCKDLQDALKVFYKEQNIRVVPFGSAVTKLALKGSDADLYFDFGGEPTQPPNEFMKALKNILYKTKLFVKACPILASVPIVKCETHSGITCDISFSNQLGVMNSKLIEFLLEMDKRTKPLILMLKFLFKKNGMIAKNGITSFTLVILVIFFLQQLKVLPSIKDLQNLATTKTIIAGWDASFSREITKTNVETQCNYSVVELLIRFFKFYVKFEFAFYIISPFTAEAYLKPIFAKSECTPPEFYCYQENITKKTHTPFELDKFMCVQDPFNHSRNISRAITQAKVLQFQWICDKSLDIWQEELLSNKKNDCRSKFFKKLFTQNMNNGKKMFNNRVITIHTDKFIGSEYIDPCSEDILRDNWCKRMTEKVIDILRRILMCKVNVVPKEKHDEKPLTLKYLNVVALLECEFEHFHLISKRRNDIRQTLEFAEIQTMNDREELISKYMCETSITVKNQSPYKFEVICFVKKGPTCFCVSLENDEEAGSHRHIDRQFVKFLKLRLPRLITS